ncbi:phospholipase D-like domain-containing protein [Candidatus Nitrosotenuis chungbukensis]|uniref:phospholipase D-like domain-containing protein n=1 Tax=Candidatus Nitrosotenuis chungbukensis TaxID=1353246 RepID=UPI0005B28962|nr:phospholipase D-like domain-containing protein [Candidatus Nitrosotenuis chungbukensis]WKT57072.1 phospholipase D-like domain-containing protein [Candidatus Nitrosotenuis chungbukensis]
MGLKDIAIKQQYRTDRDDLVADFFVPCLSNSIEYDRAVEYVTLKSISTLSLGLQNFSQNDGKIRLITGHRYRSADLNVLSKIFSKKSKTLNGNGIKHTKLGVLQDMIQKSKIQIKIAIPNSEQVDGSFSEKIGVFRDEKNDMVAYTGTSNETFNTENRNFESVDVFTSWDDRSRVDTKISDFESLWNNKTKYVQVYDFAYANENNLLKYDSHWAIETIS